MRNAKDLYDYLCWLVQDTQASEWSQARKMVALNAAYDNIVNRVIQSYENWFDKYTTLTPGTVQDEATPYELPTMPFLLKILSVTDSDGRPLTPISLQQRQYSHIDVSARNARYGYWLGHDYLWVNSGTYAETLSLYYTRKPSQLALGTAAAGSTTTMTMATGSATLQKPDPRNDYYNDVYFYLHAGTGAGERAKATDYAGSTRILTIDFSSTPDNTSEYASECELPEGHSEIISVGAALRCLNMSTGTVNKTEELWKLYGKLEMDLVEFLQNRQVQAPRSVYVRDYDD